MSVRCSAVLHLTLNFMTLPPSVSSYTTSTFSTSSNSSIPSSPSRPVSLGRLTAFQGNPSADETWDLSRFLDAEGPDFALRFAGASFLCSPDITRIKYSFRVRALRKKYFLQERLFGKSFRNKQPLLGYVTKWRLWVHFLLFSTPPKHFCRFKASCHHLHVMP
jgi:hypothetical protein